MKKIWLRLISLLLCLTLLTGCGSFEERLKDSLLSGDLLRQYGVTPYSEMVYTRPDMDALEDALAAAISAAAGNDFDRIIDRIWTFYDEYDAFFTNYSLANLHYCADLTDAYWAEEYNFCSENYARASATLEELYYALAKSPCLSKLESKQYFGMNFFDDYQGENVWDESVTALLEQESQLQSRYYELVRLGAAYDPATDAYYDACGYEMMNLLTELIALRQEIAACWGYDSYPEFASDCYYYRDYTMAQSEAYLAQIRQELVGLYVSVSETGIWREYLPVTEAETYAYVREMAGNMGGMVEESFTVMDLAGLYDISYGENKYESSFETYLYDYEVPFIFLNPTGTSYDQLAFAHEFGHFCNDYASYGSYAGTDIMEILSQGMEYLSLCYTQENPDLARLKLADGLAIYVEQAAFASFEMAMYQLSGPELTPENLMALYAEVATAYGFGSMGFDSREFVTITHFYTNPMYIMSYIVSNDAALQLYQMEQETPGAGLAILEDSLTTEEYYFLAFLDTAGLESPFAEGRIRFVRQTMEQILCQ